MQHLCLSASLARPPGRRNRFRARTVLKARWCGRRMLFVSLALLILAAPASARTGQQTSYFQNLSAQTYLPSHDIMLSIAKYPGSDNPVPATVYTVPADVRSHNRFVLLTVRTCRPARAINGRYHVQRFASHALQADLGHLTPGYYIFRLNQSNSNEAWEFCVSSFGLVRTDADSPVVTWPVDLTTFKTYRGSLDVRLVADNASPNVKGSRRRHVHRRRTKYERREDTRLPPLPMDPCK